MAEKRIKTGKIDIFTAVSIILTLLCFIPLMIDIIRGREYYEYREAGMIDARLNEVAAVSHNLGGDDELTQSFVNTYEKLKWIALAVPLEDDGSLSHGFIRLTDKDSGAVFGEWNVSSDSADENGWIYLNLDQPDMESVTEGINCELSIRASDDSDSTPFTVNSTGKDYYDSGNLMLNGEELNDDLFMIIRGYSGRTQMKWVRMWLCIYMALIVNILWGFIGRKRFGKA